MTTIHAAGAPPITNQRSLALAKRLEQGAQALARFAGSLSGEQWHTRVPGDGRTVGVVIHHVASVYPVEIQLAQTLAAGSPVTDVTWEAIHAMNALHALENPNVTPEATIALLTRNSQFAAAAILNLSDEELSRAAPVSLYGNAPLTCQFMLEDHAVRHSYHHLSVLRQVVAS